MARRESEELDKCRRLTLPPLLLADDATSDSDPKSTEQLDPKIRQLASFPP
jgi:ABC-type methionine transport system ATPase subunit